MPQSSAPPSRPTSAPVPGRKPPTGPRAYRPRRHSPTSIKSSTQKVSKDPENVKHLTCYYWKRKGSCIKGDGCAYAHHDTGILADRPLTLFPGGPARAGRNLLRAQEALRQESSDSAPEAPVSDSVQNDGLHSAKAQPEAPVTISADVHTLLAALTASHDQNASLQARIQQLELERDQCRQENYSLRTVQQQNAFLQNQINLFLTKQDSDANWLNARPFGLSSPWGAIGCERNSHPSTGASNSSSTGLATNATVTTQSFPNPLIQQEWTEEEKKEVERTLREIVGKNWWTSQCKLYTMTDDDEFLPDGLL